MVHHPPHWSTWKRYDKWCTINQLRAKNAVQQNTQFPTKSATNSPEGTGTISKATDIIIPWISILKARLLAEDGNWNTLTSTILIRALIRYVLLSIIIKFETNVLLNGWYSSISEHSKHFPIFFEYVFQHTLDQEAGTNHLKIFSCQQKR